MEDEFEIALQDDFNSLGGCFINKLPYSHDAHEFWGETVEDGYDENWDIIDEDRPY